MRPMNEYRHGTHSVFGIQRHRVWTTKYWTSQPSRTVHLTACGFRVTEMPCASEGNAEQRIPPGSDRCDLDRLADERRVDGNPKPGTGRHADHALLDLQG